MAPRPVCWPVGVCSRVSQTEGPGTLHRSEDNLVAGASRQPTPPAGTTASAQALQGSGRQLRGEANITQPRSLASPALGYTRARSVCPSARTNSVNCQNGGGLPARGSNSSPTAALAATPLSASASAPGEGWGGHLKATRGSLRFSVCPASWLRTGTQVSYMTAQHPPGTQTPALASCPR